MSYPSKKALVETLRAYHKHILGPLFDEAADTIEELQKEADSHRPRTGTWEFKAIDNDPLDPARLFKHRYYCSECGKWNSYGMTAYCPECGAKMEVDKNGEAKEEP